MKPVSTPESLKGYLPFIEPSGSAREAGDGESFETMITQDDAVIAADDPVTPSPVGEGGYAALPLVAAVAVLSPASIAAHVVSSPLGAVVEAAFGGMLSADAAEGSAPALAASKAVADPGDNTEQARLTEQAGSREHPQREVSESGESETELSVAVAPSLQMFSTMQRLPENTAEVAGQVTALSAASPGKLPQALDRAIHPSALMETVPADAVGAAATQTADSATGAERIAGELASGNAPEAQGDAAAFAAGLTPNQPTAASGATPVAPMAPQPAAQPAASLAAASAAPPSIAEAAVTALRGDLAQTGAMGALSGMVPSAISGAEESVAEMKAPEGAGDHAITVTDLPEASGPTAGGKEQPAAKAAEAPQVPQGNAAQAKGDAANSAGGAVIVSAPAAPGDPAPPQQAATPQGVQPAGVEDAPEGMPPAGEKIATGEDGGAVSAADDPRGADTEIDSAQPGDDPGRSGVFALYEAASTATARPIGHAHTALDQGAAARHVSQQVSHAVAGKPDGTVELSLSPDELGQVKVILKHEDGGIAVSIHAERQETLDLMRRHVDILARDFRDMGYTDVSFSFSDRRGNQQGAAFAAGQDFNSGTDAQAISDTSGPIPAAPRRLAAGGLDLRM